jgi:putative membrane protein
MPFALRLLLRLAVNAGALWIANALWDGVTIHGWAAYLIGAAVLAVANAVIKPILAVLTLPLIVATLGLFYFVLNVAMVALAEWIAPNFSIDGFWSYVGVVLILWIVNWAVHRIVDDLGGRNRPRGKFTVTMDRRR